ncbi:MAG: 4-(cytidine 5'-diphospho)-2-C-methyl-D-erythritol kinase [Clostridia bacterium]|nr:4-(cytidine 5'-diphospho)-2-C-methyl-D-erythritol kinase [Clostridia bacterium]
MKIKANAKINLTLDILGIREDGYHAIRSVMAPVSLCDELVIEKGNGLSFNCNIPELCGEDNLCVRAARLFYKQSGLVPSVNIYLEKKVPFPAGLGGGSADAAAVLRSLNELYSRPLEENELFALAASLGSDIPFCLLGAPALCEGRGEALTPISSIYGFEIVIAIGKGRLSTAAVYREYDASGIAPRNDTNRFLAALECGDRSALVASMGNAFEPIADKLCPETKTMREEMLSLGALNARLSGSGPSVFGVFADKETAEKAAAELRNKSYFAVNCSII